MEEKKMNETNELKTLQQQLTNLLNEDNPKELNDEILKRIKDITYLVDLTLLKIAEKTKGKTQKIIIPIYGFLKSFHDEAKDALESQSYEFKLIDEPELPDISDIDEDDRSILKTVLDTITQALPTLVDLTTSLLDNNYPYAREVKIAVNTVQDFCNKYVSLL